VRREDALDSPGRTRLARGGGGKYQNRSDRKKQSVEGEYVREEKKSYGLRGESVGHKGRRPRGGNLHSGSRPHQRTSLVFLGFETTDGDLTAGEAKPEGTS